MEDNTQTRKYIHDLANSFSILDASISRTITMLSRSNPHLIEEINRLRKADEYMKKSIDTLRQLREHVQLQTTLKKSDE